MHLAIHLENGQRVYFNEDNVIDKIHHPPMTTLLAFFELCKVDSFAKTLLYCEVPSFYTWKNNQLCRRKQGKPVEGFPGIKKDTVLGRVYTVHPGNSECYYLRLLLHHIRGPTSYISLKTVEGIVHTTFQSACLALGLLQDDAHWENTLEEASVSDSPKKIRELFTILLVFCEVADPLQLWEKYKHSLSEDIIRKLEQQNINQTLILDMAFNESLLLIQEILISISGKNLSDYGLPTPTQQTQLIQQNRKYLNEISYDTIQLTKTVTQHLLTLNTEQRTAYQDIMHSVDHDSGVIFFLDAPGGTGKTFLINLLLSTIRSKKQIALAVASSGIAATLLDGGKTAHSTFKLPLNLTHSENPLCNISKQSDMAKVIQEAKFIVWDECTMAHKGAIEALNRTLQDIRDNPTLMGGLTLLFAGDFRQTLPVVPRGTRADEVNACLKSSFLWPHVKVLSLTQNMRVHLTGDSHAERFAKLLLDIGNGNLLEVEQKIDIPNELGDVVDDLITLTNRIYPNINQHFLYNTSWLKERAILTPTNDSANNINNFLLEIMPNEKTKYESIDSVVEVEDTVHFPVEYLHTLNPPGLPPHILHLKVGAPIMLLRNLNPPKLCNGTRLQVKTLHTKIIEATIFTGTHQGETVFIPRIPLIPSDFHVQFKRLQFPVKLCYAVTINKAQGQTLKMAGVDLRNDCFSHGQLYVACSRVSSPKHLVILQPERKTRNVVYKEVLTT